MSFLCVFEKHGASVSSVKPYADLTRLVTLLCPYSGDVNKGGITSVAVPNGQLYLSSIAGKGPDDSINSESASHYLIPKNSRKTPQTSWLHITIDGSGVKFETDPLGTFPLWYFADEKRLVITSEVKSLTALVDKVDVSFDHVSLSRAGKRAVNFSPYVNIHRVDPGASVQISSTFELTISGGLPLDYTPMMVFHDDQECKAALTEALWNSVASIGAASGDWGTFLSGGIDSSTATALVNKFNPALHTYTLGTEYGDEYVEAEALAHFLGVAHARVLGSHQMAMEHFERAVFCNETIDGLTAETLAQLSILAEAAANDVQHIVTGYGADLLFGSMLRHELYMKVTGVDDLRSLIERTCWTGEFAPFFAWSLGVELHHLFWQPQLMNTAFCIPENANFDGHLEKVILRTAAVEAGLMEYSHAFRQKSAMTDGTQFNKVLSAAYDLSDDYAYQQKDELCVSLLENHYNQR